MRCCSFQRPVCAIVPAYLPYVLAHHQPVHPAGRYLDLFALGVSSRYMCPADGVLDEMYGGEAGGAGSGGGEQDDKEEEDSDEDQDAEMMDELMQEDAESEDEQVGGGIKHEDFFGDDDEG